MSINDKSKNSTENKTLSEILLGELKYLRARAGIRVSFILSPSGKILSIHEDAAYVPQELRHGPRNQHIDKDYISKWIISISRTIEFVSEKLFQEGIKYIILEGNDKKEAIIVSVKDDDPYLSFILMGILPKTGSIGLGYQEIKESSERIKDLLKKYKNNQI
ncbi:MAG: hypothetical protein EU551_03020 [Promethearchaeota archaeon]|nr:MAG: hypothetical protein EU551_03020 [Candidatus Lokiarchaeota archaeon]